MGLTPLEGLPGGTRSGSIDPSLSYHLVPPAENHDHEFHGHKIGRAEYVLNKESGYGAVAGTNDFGLVVKRMTGKEKCSDEEKARAKLAYDILEDRVSNFIGSYCEPTQIYTVHSG